MDKLAVLLVHFNPAKYRRPVDHYHRCVRGLLAQGANVVTVEASYDGAYELNGPTTMRVPAASVMWQKERLINYGALHLPSKYEFVAWVDADLLFDVDDWQERAVRVLDTAGFVQCCSHLLALPRGHTEYRGVTDYESETLGFQVQRAGGTAAWLEDRPRGANPGVAWATRRDFFELGLYERHVVGGNDAYFAGALTGREDWQDGFTAGSPAMRADADRYEGLLRGAGFDLRIGCAPGSAFHLWHGNRKKRGYGRPRNGILLDNNYDPAADVTDRDGALEWATDKPALHEAVRKYFTDRQEDE